MGYLVTAHVLKEKADFSKLRNLPVSIGTRVYYHRKAKLYLVDTFRPSKASEYPFQTPFPTVDISLELPPALKSLESVYRFLSLAKIDDGLRKSYVNFCRTLSNLLQAPVFSMISDDDCHDFACSAAAGEICRLKCRCADLMIRFGGTQIEIVPLIPEFEEDEELLTDPTPLKTVPGVRVLPRTTPWESMLHHIAAQELLAFTGLTQPILGLGSFDPPEDESDWQLLS